MKKTKNKKLKWLWFPIVCLSFMLILCVDLRPVNAQMISGTESETIDVNTQYFPSQFNAWATISPTTMNEPIKIAIPLEFAQSYPLNSLSNLGNSISFTHENITGVESVVSYEFSSPNEDDLFVQVSSYYIPLVMLDSSQLSTSLACHSYQLVFDQMVLPKPAFGSGIILPNLLSEDQRFNFSIALDYGQLVSYNNTGIRVDVSNDMFVIDYLSFNQVGIDENGNVQKVPIYVDLEVPTEDLTPHAQSLHNIEGKQNIYFLGNILGQNFNSFGGGSGVSFGDNYILIENLVIGIHAYINNGAEVLSYQPSSSSLPLISIATPLVPLDSDYSYDIYDFLDKSNGFTIEPVVIEPIDMSNWLITSVGAFMNAELFPGFALGGLLAVIIAFPIVVWFLKLLAGG